jgi:RNA polymerase sigma-70 factor (ECF subfamily)
VTGLGVVDIPPPEADTGTKAALAAEEQAILMRVRAGDTEAFGELFSRYRDEVIRLAIRWGLDPFTAEDVASETFLRVLTGIQREGSATDFTGRGAAPLLIEAAKRVMVDRFRRARNRLEEPSDVVELRGSASSAEDIALQAWTAQALWAAVAKLLPGQRNALVYRFLLGLSVNEAAGRAGMATGTIKSHQHHGIRALREMASLFTDTGST